MKQVKLHVRDEFLLELLDKRLAEVQPRLSNRMDAWIRQRQNAIKLRTAVKRMRAVIAEMLSVDEADA